MNAQYNRWKYMVRHDLPIPVELDKAILDKMQGNDGFTIPLKDADLITAEEDLICVDCGEKYGTYKVAEHLEIQDIFARGMSFCLVPDYHRDCPQAPIAVATIG